MFLPCRVLRALRALRVVVVKFLLSLLVSFVLHSAAHACDICAIYTATELQENRRGIRIGVAEQYSSFSTLRDDGDKVDNPDDELLESSITQVQAGYRFHPRVGVTLTLPIIARSYRRREAGGVVRGDETGIGDISALADFLLYSRVTESSVLRFSVLGGIKFPTGDADRLGEEAGAGAAGDDDHGGLPEEIRDRLGRVGSGFRLNHDEPEGFESGVHGHDLALGTGSADVVFGGQILATWERLLVTSSLQYIVRTEGSFDYQYANELSWSLAPGVFALLDHDHSLAAQVVFSGETKGTDSLDGRRLGDTGLTALYLGPGFHLTLGSSLSADVAADIPVLQNNTSLQIVADYRLRGGLVWRF